MSGTAAARLHLHEARMRIRIFLFDGNESCLSKISVRQAKGLPTASFRFRLTMDILAVQLCASSLPARTRDLHLLEPAHDWRTKKAPAKPALCAVSLLLLIIALIFGGMYVGFTRAEYTIVEGVQGRYFIPILALILILFEGNRISLKLSYKKVIYFTSLVVLYIPSLLTMVEYFNK